MDWNKCLYFSNNIQCNNKKYENSVCKKHKNNKFDSDYLFICLSGEGYLDPTKLHNQTDIVSLEGIWEYKNKKKVVNLQFPRELLFSFIDNSKLYGFNILSLTSFICDPNEFIKKNLDDFEIVNPITRNKFTNMQKIKLKLKLQYLIDFNHPDIINIRNFVKPFDQLMNIIVKFENNGFFFNPDWYKNLSNIQIKNIINETKLIWNEYNTPLDFPISNFDLKITSLIKFYNFILNIKNVNINNKIIIILGGLAYVIPEVKLLYPDLLHE